MQKLVIDRSRWLPLEAQTGGSWLYDPDTNRMCCLGLFFESLGWSKESIKNKATPIELQRHEKKFNSIPKWLLTSNGNDSKIASLLMSANDGGGVFDGLSLADREAKIISIFAEQDIELSFVGELFPS